MKRLLVLLPLIIIFGFMVGCQCNAECETLKAQAELEEKNLELVRQAWTDWNNRNLDFLTDLENPDDYAYYSPVGTSKSQSHEEVIGMIKALWAGFSDITINPIDMIASGDKVITTYLLKGTHDGEFNGIPATGNKMEAGIISIVRIKDGVIVEEWENFDAISFMGTLGFSLQPNQ
jgi:predicted ester cyclase